MIDREELEANIARLHQASRDAAETLARSQRCGIEWSRRMAAILKRDRLRSQTCDKE